VLISGGSASHWNLVWRNRHNIVRQPLKKLLGLLQEMDVGLTQLELCFEHIHVPLPLKDASILERKVNRGNERNLTVTMKSEARKNDAQRN
jgi:hypothetical protein